MATLFALLDAQQFLSEDKYVLSTPLEEELVGTSQDIILGKLRVVFDTSSWEDDESTPSLVRSILGMYYAGTYFDRYYAEEFGDPGSPGSYGQQLRDYAISLVTALIEGNMKLPEVEDTADLPSRTRPAFYPTDSSTRLDEGRAFEMGARF